MSNVRPIIAILTDRYIEYQADLVESITTELSCAGYGALCVTGKELQAMSSTASTDLTANTIYSAVNQFDISGLIILSGTIAHGSVPNAILDLVKKFSVPKVSMGMKLPFIPSVYLDESKGMADLMDHLLTSSEKKYFAFIRGHQNDPYSLKREAIFKSSLLAGGHNLENCVFVEGDYNAFTTYQAIDELFNSNIQLDCIVAANDVMAASAAQAAKVHGISIPSQLSISGFDDTSDATSHSPAITTVRQPTNKLAVISVELLIQQMEQPASTTTFNASICIPTELIIRRSTVKAKNEYPLVDSVDEPELRRLLIDSMRGLEMPSNVTMKNVSEPLWQTLVSGNDEIITFAQRLDAPTISRHAHWFINICDQIEIICRKLLSGDEAIGRIAIVSSAVFTIREKVWDLQSDQQFEISRLQNAKSEMMLQMSSCAEVQDIILAMDSWLSSLKPHRCFLVRYANAGSTPDEHAELIHVFRNAAPEPPSSTLFRSSSILPVAYQNEISSGLLVLCPICVDDIMFGYLLIDPRDTLLLYIDFAAQCIGNAMRTHYHIEALRKQRDSLESVNEELEQLANFDALTGLSNRLQFTKYLDKCCEATPGNPDGVNFWLLFIDLDGFKLINDTLGHAAGDQLLDIVAKRLLSVTSRSSEFTGFISRLGGDEFTVILHKKVESADLAQITHQFLESLSGPYQLCKNVVSVSASIGCSSFPTDAKTADNIVQCADTAMYNAKKRGKNKVVFFSPEMITADVNELRLAQELRHALDHNELCMQYLPRIDLKTGKICAAEAIMHWYVKSSDGEVVKADSDVLMALAEKIGVIEQIDDYAFNYSCKQAAQWSEAGIPLPVSVNISTKQLQQPAFISTVAQTIARHKLDPALLELEITESAAMTDVDENTAKFTDIKSMGITISIVDFGTDYSSLNHLKHLPIDNLKIDQYFISDITKSDGGDSANASIIRAVVALGKSMGFSIVAEGIETNEQKIFIESLACDQAQGHFFSEPLSANMLSTLLDDDQNNDIAA